MYKCKDTKDAYTNDLVMWTNLPEGISNRIPYKVYLVKRKDGNFVEILDENNKLQLYGKIHGFKVLQTKPASQAKVGDYIFRLTEGPEEFPKGEIRKITEIDAKLLWYTSTNDVHHDEVIVIEQAEEDKQEKEKSYPYFLQGVHNDSPLIVRQDRDSYTYLHVKSDTLLGLTFEGTHSGLKPCDFTIEPEIYDLEWYQQRFKSGLPVYAIDSKGDTFLCKGLSPKEWNNTTSFSITDNQSNTTNKPGAQQEPASKTLDIDNPSTIEEWDARFKAGLPVWYILDVAPIQATKLPSSYIFGNIFFTGPMKYVSSGNYFIPWGEVASCQDSIKANQQKQKEQPMDKTTLKLLLELLGATEEVKDATNSKFVGIITNEDEYIGYMYFDSKEDAIECMSQPKMELHKLHLFEKSCVLAQKPRKVIEL